MTPPPKVSLLAAQDPSPHGSLVSPFDLMVNAMPSSACRGLYLYTDFTYNLRETSTAIHNVNATVVVPSVARIRYV